MDAKHYSVLTIGSLALVLSGCELGARPMKADIRTPVQPTEKPIIVGHEDKPVVSQSVDPMDQNIKAYIERVDDISRQARRSRRPERTLAAEADTRRSSLPARRSDDDSAVENEQSVKTAAPLPKVSPAATTPANDVEDKSRAESADDDASTQAPPAISSVTVRGARSQASYAVAPSDTPPGVNAPATAVVGTASASDALAAWLSGRSDASFAGQLDTRLARILSGDYEAAHDPFSDVSDDRQQLATHMIDALIAIREGHDGDPSGAANAALQAVERLAGSLRKSSDLEIPSMALCRSVEGFGRYTPLEPAVFRAGVVNEFVSYCEVKNFHSERAEDGSYLTRFSMRTTILNRAGDAVLDIKDADVLDRCRNLRRDCFLSRVVRLPATLSPGEYVAKVTLVDKLGEKVAENRAAFRIITGP